MTKLRVLTISKPYVSAAYRQKFRILAEDPSLEIGLITGKNWAGQNFETYPGEGYWLRTLDIALNGKNHFHYYKGLEAAIREFKPDVLNIEEEHYSFVTYQAMRIARKLKAKTLFYTWQNIDKSYPPPFSWIESYVFRNCQVAVNGNQEALDILRRKGFKGKAAIIPQMGADPDTILKGQADNLRFRSELRHSRKIPESALTLAFAGRLVEEKGVQDSLRALSLLQKKGKLVHFLILGQGPYGDELKSQTKALGLEAQVHFLGSVPSMEIYRYLGAADALVLNSHTKANWKEQFGRILIEAMLAGLVPIGSSSGEIPQVIADAGLVHKEQDSEDLATKIEALHDDRDLQKALAIKAKDRVTQNFTNQKIASAFAGAFHLAAKS